MTKSAPVSWRRTTGTIYLTCLVLLSCSNIASGDAIIRSQAMFADTIAEYFVEDGQVRVELEIGLNDLAAFRNLLPDELYRNMEFGDAPQAERIGIFTSEDMPLFVGEKRLEGVVTALGPGTRPLRDDITGEVLPTPEDEAQVVVRATVLFPFSELPESLTLVAPRKTGMANVGFVLYHNGVAVNDYRYLSAGLTVNLDWEDAWYSEFSERALRRQYYSPMTGFIYVEPYEVRKEIILRPSDVQQFVDLGLEGETVIPAERHDEIKQKVIEYLSGHFPVTIDGKPVEGTVDRANFLNRTLISSNVVDYQDLDLLSSSMGVIYVFPTDGLPQNVEMEWDIFTDKMRKVPAATVDQAGSLPVTLEEGYEILRWENFLRFPELPTLAAIERPPTAIQRAAAWGRFVGVAAFILFLGLLLRRYRREKAFSGPLTAASVLAALVAVSSSYQYRQSSLDQEQLEQLVNDLLHNVYRAFDYRGEEVIYDVLEKSVSGELLTDIYLETQKGLELANQGGARVKVKSTEVQSAELLSRTGNQLNIESNWNVGGSVGHWGHVHQRSNSYRANLQISEIDGAWKLTGLEILEEQRL